MRDDVFGPERFVRSLRRSQRRRAQAATERRRRIRLRGGGVSVLAVALLTATAGAGLALGESAVKEGGAAAVTTGSSGSLVTAVQQKLGVSPTGNFGSATRRAVRSFQRKNGLIVDGIVGPQTLSALGLAPRQSDPDSDGVSKGGSGSAPSGTLQKIAQCESGGNPQAVSKNGRYRGKYQFDRATWRAMGGSGDPAAAPEAEQDRIAAKLLRQRGTGSWPSCA
jgi:hypothetical protein